MLVRESTVAIHIKSDIYIESRVFRKEHLPHRVKRIADILLSTIGLAVLLPVLLIAAVGIIICSPGSPLFVQNRIGRHGEYFPMIKLRTMKKNAHLLHVAALKKEKNDSRIFPLGKILRRTSIDEITNLINVLKGEMSIIGPRPMLENEFHLCIERHGRAIADERLRARPGITGLWQISGRSNLNFDERIRLDLQYVREWTLLGDLRILIRTIPAILSSRGAF